ncbi:MAG TPA: ABC transporter permease [Lacunisphaera sp.]|jgi:putative ABC transport system permease protein
MESFLQDLRYALRGLRKQPAFTALVVLTLALGIGGATTMFSVIQNVLLDPFPYVDAQHVVMPQVRDAKSAGNTGRASFRPREFLEFAAQTQVFSDVIGSAGETILYTTREGTERLTGTLCSGNMFQFLGVPALLGRTLTPEDAKPGAPPVFVIRYNSWVARFNSDPAILGQAFVLNGVPRTLVGIMPPRFTKAEGEFYLAVAIDPADAAVRDKPFRFQARLQPGVTLAQAQAALDTFAHHRAQEHPEDYPRNFSIRVVSWVDNIVRDFRQTLYTLAAAVGLLLFIACANVANLLLARASTREKEMAVRAALGAGRTRIVRQLLVESFVLALLGMLLGCVLARYGIPVLAALIPERAIPDEADIRLNMPALLFSLGAAAMTALAFGIVPAMQAGRTNLIGALKDSSQGGGFRRGKFRSALVITEVALSLVLLSGAGLLMRSFAKIQAQEPGLDAGHLLYAPLTLPPGSYETAAAKQKFFRALLPRLETLPGVVAVSTGTSLLPMRSLDSAVEIRGQTTAEVRHARYDLCSENYFSTLGLHRIGGRLPDATEIDTARSVAVVNETFARNFFGPADPIGRQVRLERVPISTAGNDAWFEIVGVIADFKNDGAVAPPAPEIFLPYTVTAAGDRAIFVRTAGEPLALLATVRREIWAVDRNVALTESDSVAHYLTRYAYAAPRFTLVVLGVFAGVGLVLVALGVYSVMAYIVARQTRDFGVRMALGASANDVLRLVFSTGFALIGAGIAVGVAASLAVTRVLANLLWQVSPHDFATLASVIGIIVLTGLAACFFPARRATRVDPLVALRRE